MILSRSFRGFGGCLAGFLLRAYVRFHRVVSCFSGRVSIGLETGSERLVFVFPCSAYSVYVDYSIPPAPVQIV